MPAARARLERTEPYRREVAVDKLNFNADGSIQPVTRTSGLTF